ncbi:tyrosine-type recombinase/integrase [Deferrisoma camini]|uniref:tyrosine-type recombinase/integrase n=1 Tax=Deferrisoma camini TaxID=1035120 RepID=UPI00146F1338|nr:site-specific integrase [Deferrisoma camini]
MRYKLTDVRIRQTKADKGRRELRDGGGLGLWIYPSGQKVWFFEYWLPGVNGEKQRHRWSFAEYPTVGLQEARKRHQEYRELVRRGIDPKAELEQKKREEAAKRQAAATELTVEELCRSYMEIHAAPNKRSFKEDQRQIRRYILPALGSQKAKEITRRDVQALLDSVGRRAPIQSNRLRALMSRLFRWAMARGHVDHNPVEGTERVGKEVPRTRTLTVEEIRIFWQGLDNTALSDSVKQVLRLLLVLGQRPGEIAGMQYEELRIQGGIPVWTIPGGRRKNGRPHEVPLPALALDIIGPWQGKTGYVFPGPKGTPVTVEALSRALRRNLGEPEKAPPKKHGKRQAEKIPIHPPFTPHDLRRTVATRMSEAGVSKLLKPIVLGHTPQDVTSKHYDLFEYLEEKTGALNMWANYLIGILKGKEEPSNIIQLQNHKRLKKSTQHID